MGGNHLGDFSLKRVPEAGPPPCTKDYHNLAALSPEPQEPSWDTPQQLISSRTAYDSPKASETPLLKGIPSVKEP